MLVYHYSEDPTIKAFVPRPSRLNEDLVWAIDVWHSPLYWLPRDCPRVCFWPLPSTTEQDYAHWWSSVSGRMVIAIEQGWVERLRNCTLYRYTFDQASFFSLEDHGVHVSREAVSPLQVEPMGDLLVALSSADIELRFCPRLGPLGKAIIQSSLHFSLIRMRNALDWES